MSSDDTLSPESTEETGQLGDKLNNFRQKFCNTSYPVDRRGKNLLFSRL